MAQQWNTRTYLIELGAAFALYAVLLVGHNLIERAWRPEGFALLAVNLMPVVGILAAAWAIVRGFAQMDELQRRIQFDALVLAFLGTAIASITWGFVEDMGVPPLRAFMVWPVMAAFWVIGLIVATLRYAR